MTKAPCKECPHRKVGCHSICEKYIEWCQVHNLELEDIRKKRNSDGMFADHIVRSASRAKRRKNK